VGGVGRGFHVILLQDTSPVPIGKHARQHRSCWSVQWLPAYTEGLSVFLLLGSAYWTWRRMDAL